MLKSRASAVEFQVMEQGSSEPRRQVTPPPQVAFAAYPRAAVPQVYGNSERLRLAYRAYHGLTYTVLFEAAAWISFIAAVFGFSEGPVFVGVLFSVVTLVAAIATFYMSIRSCRDLAYASSWQPSTGIILGILGPVVGIIPLGIFQYLAVSELKMHGMRQGAFQWVKKREYLELLEMRREYEKSAGIRIDDAPA